MKMVDVGAKDRTERIAVATCRVRMKPQTLELIRKGKVEKGNVIEAAKLAAIMAAKRTPDIVPLCHPIALTSVSVDVEPVTVGVEIRVEVKTVERTGVEMEALTAASAAALTVYDMLKSQDRGMVIEKLQLEHKSGGRTGVWDRTGGGRSRRAKSTRQGGQAG
ncbi:MAG: cyclic pyranopterin monophosphate synthase MoaC [Myxococcaceae bacterium]